MIPNNRLLALVGQQTSMVEAFRKADSVLLNAVQGISDLMTVPGLINVDFADVRTIMSGMGRALMGTGIGTGKRRATEAAEMAISSPLLEDVSIEGATGILINITGGPDLTLHEVNEASSLIQQAAHEDANIIFGSVIDPNLSDEVRITVIATGFDRARRPDARRAADASRSRAAARDASSADRAADRAAVRRLDADHARSTRRRCRRAAPPPAQVVDEPEIDIDVGRPTRGAHRGRAGARRARRAGPAGRAVAAHGQRLGPGAASTARRSSSPDRKRAQSRPEHEGRARRRDRHRERARRADVHPPPQRHPAVGEIAHTLPPRASATRPGGPRCHENNARARIRSSRENADTLASDAGLGAALVR